MDSQPVTGNEFDDGGCHFMGKTLQVTLRRPANLDVIRAAW